MRPAAASSPRSGFRPDVAQAVIVILNWNNAPDTLACLASVDCLDYPNYRTLVVDNRSTDSSIARVRAAYPGVEILALPANVGYGEGNNAGIRRALDLGADYVLVLNNDTRVAPEMLAELIRVAESQPDIGMVGPTMFCVEPEDTLFAAGSFVDWWAGTIRHRGMFELTSRHSKLHDPEPVDFVVGCGVLASAQFLRVGGLLDPVYYMNFEDVEWGIRARRHGFAVLYAPRAVMWHKVSATLGLASPANTYYMTRNALLFFWRNAPAGLRLLAVSRILARTAWIVAAWTLKPRYHIESFERKRNANLMAVRDFFLGRFGPMPPDAARICYQSRSP